MTLVMARKIEKWVGLFADTQISDPQQARENRIPGNLKIIIIDNCLTIAYSGLEYHALKCIRVCNSSFHGDRKIITIFNMLSDCSNNHGCEFIVVYHENGNEYPTLKKIFDGYITDNLSEAWIGNPTAADVIIRNVTNAESAGEVEIDLKCEPYEEFYKKIGIINFEFMKLLLNINEFPEGVGGVEIESIASPNGHFYRNSSGCLDTSTIKIGPDNSFVHNDVDLNYGGQSSWGYSTIVSGYRGVALLGLSIENTGTCYIYDPINSDIPIKLSLSDPSIIKNKLDCMAIGRGGIRDNGRL